MSATPQQDANEKAGLVAKYIAVLLGNISAVSAIYFAVRNDFVMPQTMQVVGLWFAFWVIAVLIVHTVLRPWLAGWYERRMRVGNE